MKKLLFFSNNKSKIKEVCEIFKDSEFEILSLNNYDKIIDPRESGKTFEENAKIKSKFGFDKFNISCFADDSGICIEAMNNLPGIKSKRYFDKNRGYKKTFDIIIKNVVLNKNYKAFFQTSIFLTVNNNIARCFEGKIFGTISVQPLGSQGFGYDSIFIPDGHNRTFAQMHLDEKNKISHRAIALDKLKVALDSLV